MMFKLGQCAEKPWRKLRGFAHLADVIKGVNFVNGIKPPHDDRLDTTFDNSSEGRVALARRLAIMMRDQIDFQAA